MPDVRHQGFGSSKPENARLVRTVLASDASSALRQSAFADRSSPTHTGRRQPALLPFRVPAIELGLSAHRDRNVLSRPANDLRAYWAPALPVSGTSLLPSPGAAARAGLIPVLLRFRRSPVIAVHSGGSAPAFKMCRQLRRAGASVSSYTFGGLTSACSRLATLAADARR